METCTVLCSTLSCALAWADAHATALVAVVAILFTFWQVRVARTHNKISVRPRLYFHVETEFPQVGEASVRLSVRNYGLGPAFVDAIEYRSKGALFDVHDPAQVKGVLTEIFGDKHTEAEPLFQVVDEYAIPKDEVMNLARVQTVWMPDEGEGGNPLPKLRKAISVVVRYRSPYNEALECKWPE